MSLEEDLFNAVQENNIPEIYRLIAEDADVNANIDGFTPLHVAQTSQAAQILIAAGADVNAKDLISCSPMHRAQNAEIAQDLIGNGANAMALNNRMETPLHWAKSAKIAQILIDNGANVNAKDSEMSTPLHSARSAAIAELLIKAGANVNEESLIGRPLHLTLDPNVVQVLIDNGADVNVQNQDGDTPLARLNSISFPETAELLLKAGADVMLANINHHFISGLLLECDSSLSPEEWGERISKLLIASEKLQNNILHMLSNYPYQNQVTSTYAALANTHPEVVVGAAKAGRMLELVKVKHEYPEAMNKAFDLVVALDPSFALEMVEYLPGVPDNHAELGYNKLHSVADANKLDLVLAASHQADIFARDASGMTAIEKTFARFGLDVVSELLHWRKIADLEGEKNYNSVALGSLYSADLLDLANILIANGAIGLNGCAEDCGNIIIRALKDGKLDWVDMLLDAGIAEYSETGLAYEAWNAVCAPALVSAQSIYNAYNDTEYHNKIMSYLPIISKIFGLTANPEAAIIKLVDGLNTNSAEDVVFTASVKCGLEDTLSNEEGILSHEAEELLGQIELYGEGIPLFDWI